jgi:hypothetical protein
MLAAIVIVVLFMGSVFAIYIAATSSIARAKDQQEIYQTARVLLGQLSTELTSAYQPSTATLSALSGTLATNATTGLNESTVTFITSAHPAPASVTASDLCQVSYEIAGDGTVDSPVGLYVTEDYHPGIEMTSETLTPRLVSPRVTGIACSYLNSAGVWSNTWDATTETTLPVAVRVELTLQSRNTATQPIVFATTANLMTATAPATTGTSTGGSNATP